MPENQTNNSKMFNIGSLAKVSKVGLALIGGLIALFGLLIVVVLACIYFSNSYYALGILNVSNYNVLLQKVAVDGDIVYEGGYTLEPTQIQDHQVGFSLDRPDRLVRIDFTARKPKRLDLAIFDPDLNEERTVSYKLEDKKGSGCVFQVRYGRGEFSGQPRCEPLGGS